MLSHRLNHLRKIAAIRSYNTNGMTHKSARAIRKEFLDYFTKDLNHTYVPSSPVQPMNDPTIPFVNAGMNQFKGVFLGHHDPPAARVANSQKCIRVGGKHNDLEAVGLDTYHHTFFEMLGNWSFGDYSKAEACEYAWRLLTGPYGLKKEHLYVTYFAGDERLGLEADSECKDIWLRLGVPESRLLPFGAQDNFWEMGLSGPCGPCTEIHVDHTMQSSNQAARVNKGYSDLTELWNIVFINHQRLAGGSIVPLGKQHVDTGMGFERLVAILQGKRSNYDTDLFAPLFRAISSSTTDNGRLSTGLPMYKGRFGEADKNSIDAGYRILADHARMVTVALADGMIPDQNPKLRRVLRKALAVGEQTFRRPGLLRELSNHVAESLGNVYPEIWKNLKQVQMIIEYEEELWKSVRRTAGVEWKKLIEIRPALEAVSDSASPGLVSAYKDLQNSLGDLRKIGSIPGDFAFKLYDTYGLGPETISELAAIECLAFDRNAFDRSMEEAKLRSKTTGGLMRMELVSGASLDLLETTGVPKTDDSPKYRYTFGINGYEFPPVNAKILAFLVNGKLVSEAKLTTMDDDQTIVRATVAASGNIVGADSVVDESTEIGLILDKTLCYAPEGGQMSDKGFIKIGNLLFNVEQVHKVRGYVVHVGRFVNLDTESSEAELVGGDDCVVSIDGRHRTALMRNHTSTHLLNAALRQVLQIVSQRSSLVTKTNLTFQFGLCGEKFGAEHIARLEQLINDCIASDAPVTTKIVDMRGLLAEENLTLIPGEVYPDTEVRIVEIDSEPLKSKEACCGTHVHKTGALDHFCILGVKSQGATNRTIRAVAGPLARLARLAGESAKQEVAGIVEDIEKGNVQPSLIVAKIMKAKRDLGERSDRRLVAYLDTRECQDRLDELLRTLQEFEKKDLKISMEAEMTSVVHATKMPFVVHCLQPVNSRLDEVSLQRVTRLCSYTPVLVIAHSSDRVKARCCVPKEMVSGSFNAQLWMQTISTIFKAHCGAPTGQDSSLACDMNTKKVRKKILADLVEKAITQATKFAEMHVNKSNEKK